MNETEKELKNKYIPKHVLEKWLLKNGWEKYDNLQRYIFVKFPDFINKTGCAIKLPSGLSFNGNCLYYDDNLFGAIAAYSNKDLDLLMKELKSSILNNEK
jgi:hypothetical protein